MPRGAREITLRFLAGPTDAGYSGTVGGGRVLEWIDKAGYAAAAGWSGTYCVTAYVGNVRFTRPVEVGRPRRGDGPDIHTGTSSMHILVTVSAGNPRQPELLPTTECLMVFVAVGADGTSDAGARPRAADRTGPPSAAERPPPDRPALRDRRLRWRPRPTATRAPRRAPCCASSRPPPTSTGAARSTAASSCGGSTRRPTCWRPAGPERRQRRRLLRRGALLPSAADRTPRRGRGPAAAHRHLEHAHQRARAIRRPGRGELDLTTHSLIVFVPLDDDGNAVPAPAWKPVSEEDVALRDHALELVALRHQIDAERHVP